MLLSFLASSGYQATAAPIITGQPKPAVVAQGSNHTFQVAASGVSSLQYQWTFQGNDLSGETNATLSLSNVETNNSGPYFVVVSDSAGAVTSAVAHLTVRLSGAPIYLAPSGGWSYRYDGSTLAIADNAALDGTWSHSNGSDSWAFDGRGAGDGVLGGVGTTNGILTLEDDLAAGAGVDNRRFYFTHVLGQDGVTNGSTILNDGVTLSFRARLTPPTDSLIEMGDAPNGFINAFDGKGMIGLRQVGSSGSIISFSLNRLTEDTNATTTYNFPAAGLHVNNLNGSTRGPQVDPGEGGTLNVVELDPTAFHEFWITIQDNGVDPGTHRVAIYVDGGKQATNFNVTAGSGFDLATNYLAIGLPSVIQRAAFDLDYVAYRSGVHAPMRVDEPATITSQPESQLVLEGTTATFSVSVAGTPPIAVQWYRNGEPIPNATNATYSVSPALAPDSGAQFSALVSNLANVEMSAPATLEVVGISGPSIVANPQSLTVTNGDAASFAVIASGTPPLNYQWQRNGAELSGATNPVLVIPTASPGDSGLYDVVVSNSGGSTNSLPANLQVHAFDFGDAPAPFPSALAQNGARHLLVPGIHLGTTVDYEVDALETDTDDGVAFLTSLRVGQTAQIEIVAATNGVLNAWIDFDGNDSWDEENNQIIANENVSAGTNVLAVSIPPGANGGATWARFRFSTTSNLPPVGAAADGEVEDYPVSILAVADISLSATVSNEAIAVGSNITYLVVASNAGPSVATQIVVTNLPSGGLAVVNVGSTQGSCTHENGIINCNLGSLAAGGAATITIEAQSFAAGTLDNTFFVSGAEEDPIALNNVAVASTSSEVAPTISVQPESVAVVQGQSAQFAVTATGTAPLSFQWFFNDVPMPEGTNEVVTIAPAQTSNAGTYRVQVTNRVGSAFSEGATLTVLRPPTIVQQPQSQTNLAGGAAVFQVTATGTEPLSFQWSFNVTNALANETNATLVITNLQLAHAGIYAVTVTNAAGVVTSGPVLLEVIPMDFGDAPGPFPTALSDNGARHRLISGFHLGAAVNAEPDAMGDDNDDGVAVSSSFLAGQSAEVRVVASSNGVLNAWIDWNGNGKWSDAGEQVFSDQLLGSGTNTFSLSVPPTAAGGQRATRWRLSTAPGLSFTGEAPDGEVEDYLVAVTAVADLALQLVVERNPVTVGSNLTYFVTVTNTGPSAASSVVLRSIFPAEIAVVSATSDKGACFTANGEILCDLGVLASGEGGDVVFVTVPNAPGGLLVAFSIDAAETDPLTDDNQLEFLSSAFVFPAITADPQSATVTNGSPATFSVAASGTSLTYQWLLQGSPIPNATNATYIIASAAAEQAGVYRVRVYNAVGEVVSAPAELVVLEPPIIVSQPLSAVAALGEPVSFHVVATGSTPLAYQWSHDGADLPAATGATLTISAVSLADEGTYRVKVSNAAGEVLSNPVQLTVFASPVITTQPTSQSLFAGESIVLQVTATGTGPLSYHWFFGGGLLSGASASSLTISNAQAGDSGEYYVVVSNAVATSTSTVAQVTVTEADFGDAPGVDYATRRVFNAAYHTIAPGFRLGSRIDFETDGQPDATASGDDLGGEDDEDGVRFPGPLLVGQLAVCEVVASTNGFIDAWIDFNGNGDWVDASEQILVARPVTPGTNNLVFSVLASASAQTTFARFRFSANGNLDFSGPASEGEVEDYAVTIIPGIDLRVSAQDTPDPVEVNSNLSLAITVANNGASAATGVRLSEVLPDNVTLLSVTPSQGACSNASGIIQCDLGQLAGGGSALVTVQMIPRRIGLMEHRLEVSGNETEVTVTNNVRIEPTSVVSLSSLFRNAAPITLPDGLATAYPSSLTVTGVPGTVQKVVLTLYDLTHAFPDDLDVLLVGPGGQTAVVMSDAGGGNALSFVTLTFDETSELILPDNGRLVSQGYRTSNYEGTGDSFPLPAPPSPYGSSLNVFKNGNPNGIWSLYIVDDVSGEGGILNGGWSLRFEGLDPIAEIAVGATATPQPVDIGQTVTLTVAVTNLGPASADRVVLTNVLAGSYTLQSLTTTHGSCTNSGGQIVCDLGTINAGAIATVSATIYSEVAQRLTNQVIAAGSEVDFTTENNAASLPIIIGIPPTILSHPPSIAALIGDTVTLQVVATGTAPLAFQWRWNGVDLLHATNSSLTFSNVTPLLDGAYFVRVSNGAGDVTSEGATLIVHAPPTISVLPDLTLVEDTASAEIPFLVGDFETSAESLEVTAASSNSALFPLSNIVFSGAASNRTVRVIPAANEFGTAMITVTVRDAQGAIDSDSFQVVVEPVNDLPSVSAVSDQTMAEDGSVTIPISFSDVETPISDLTLSVSTDNEALIPVSGLVLTGSGNDRQLSVQPRADAHGIANISVRADDGTGGLVTRSFAVEVVSVNDLPTVTVAATVTTDEDGTETVLALTDIGVGATNESQTVTITAAHNNTNLIANLAVEYSGGSTGLVRFATLTNAYGLATIDLVFNDGGASNNITTRAVSLTVNPINDLPTISSIGDVNLVEDTLSAEIAFSITDVETGPGDLMIEATSSNPAVVPVQNVVFAGVGSSRTLRVTPALNQSGSALVTINVRDEAGGGASTSFTVVVTPENDPPSISAVPNQVVAEDGEILFPITVFDAETAPEVLVVDVESSNTNLVALSGVLVSGTGVDRTLTVRPSADESGMSLITLTVTDTNGAAASQTFEVLVQSVNDTPVLDPIDDLQIAEDSGAHAIVLLGIGSGAANELQTLTLAAEVAPSNLVANLMVTYVGGTTGLLSFVTVPDVSGVGTVTVTIDDGGSSNNIVTRSFAISISEVNDLPVLAAIPGQGTAEDVPISVPLLLSDTETPAALLSLNATSSNTNLIDGTGFGFNGGVLTLTPRLHEFGVAEIAVSVTDASNAVVTQTFQFSVSPVNDAPSLDPLPDLTLNEDAPPQTIALTNLTSGAPNETQPLLVRATSSNPALIPQPRVTVQNSENRGALTFTPVPNSSGTATITVTVDDLGLSNNVVVRSFTIDVNAVNDFPKISQILNQATYEGVPLQISFTVSDAETAAADLQLQVMASNGLLLPPGSVLLGGTEAERTIQINPASDVAGEATITISVSDSDGGSNSMAFVLTVTAVNNAPTISDVPDQQAMQGQLVGPIAFTVGDSETVPEGIQVVAHSSNAALIPGSGIVLGGSGATRTVSIFPAANLSGTATITLVARDADGASASDTFVLEMQAINNPPVISTIPDVSLSENTVLALPFTVSDDETDVGELIVTVASTNLALFPEGALIVGGSGADRNLTITPAADEIGTAEITIAVADGDGGTTTETFLVEVIGSSIPLLITGHPQSQTIPSGTSLLLNVSAVGSGPIYYQWFFNNGLFTGETNALLSLPVAQTSNSGTYFVVLSNALGAVTSDVAQVTVVPQPNVLPPVISDILDQIGPEDSTIRISFDVSDPDTPAHFLAISATSANTALIPSSNVAIHGSGNNRTLELSPVAQRSGTSLITVTVSDGVATASDTFLLTVDSVNDAPTLDAIADISAQRNNTSVIALSGIGPGASDELELLSVTAASSNPALIPTPTVSYLPGATAGSISLRPNNGSGAVTITVQVSDGQLTTVRTFTAFVRANGNANPTISTVAGQVISEDGSTGPIAVTVSDTTTAPASLVFSARSSDTNLVPPDAIALGGSGSTRTVTITPAPNRSGTATIFLAVTDGEFGVASTSFSVAVTPVNELPTITAIPNQSVQEDTATAPLAFSIADVESLASGLLVSATSSNPALIPGSSIALGGSGSNRVIVITPASNQFGNAAIQITVADPAGASAVTSFEIAVSAENDLPQISALADIAIQSGESSPALPFTVADLETSAGDLTLAVNSSDESLLPISGIVLGGFDANRTVTVSPAPNATGIAVISVTVTDGGGASATEAFAVVMTGAQTNAPPTLDPLAALVINEGSGPHSISLSGISAGIGDAGQHLTVSAVSSNPEVVPHPAVNYAVPANTGSLTLLANPGTNGVVEITVSVNDGLSLATQTFEVTVRGLPVISPVMDVSIPEDSVIGPLAFTIGDAETLATNLQVLATSSNPSLLPEANITFAGDESGRSVSLVPSTNEFGFALITLIVTDSDGLSSSAQFGVVVTPVNDTPTLDAIPDRFISTDEGPQVISLSGITSGATNEAQPLMITTTSSNPTLVPPPTVDYISPAATGALTFAASRSGGGIAEITVTVTDGQLANQFFSRTFTVAIGGVENPPTLDVIPDLTVDEDSGTHALVLTGIGPGEGNETQTVVVSAESSDPSLVPPPSVVYTNGQPVALLTVTPAVNAFGSAVVTVAVSDGLSVVTESFAVVVTPQPEVVTLSQVLDQTVPEDGLLGPLPVIVGDDSGGTNIVLTAVSLDTTLIPNNDILLQGVGAERTISLRPATNQVGMATIYLTAALPTGEFTTNSFVVTVTPVNDHPIISAILPQVVNEDSSTLPIAFTVEDVETTAGALVLSASSSNPALVPNSGVVFSGAGLDRFLVITPSADQFGVATIRISVADSDGGTNETSFEVTVIEQNDAPPTLDPIPNLTINEATGPHVVALAGISAGLGDLTQVLTVSAASSDPGIIPNPVVSYVSPNAVGSLTFSANPATNGVVLISVTVNDGVESVVQSFIVTVSAVDDPPTLAAIADVTVDEDSGAHEILLTGISAGDVNEQQSLTISAVSSDPAVIPHPGVAYTNGQSIAVLSFTPALNAAGSAVITVSVSDGSSTTTETFAIVVNSLPETLTLSMITDQLIDEDQLLGPLAFVVGDDSGGTNVTVLAETSNPELVPAEAITLSGLGANRSITLQPATNQFGSATISLIASLPSGESVTNTFSVIVNAVNDAPRFVLPVADQSVQEDSSITVPFTVDDVETSAAALSLEGLSSNGVLVASAAIDFGGAGAERTLTLAPAQHQHGTTVIQIRLRDADGAYATNEFTLTVGPVDDAPSISELADRFIMEDQEAQLTFLVNDADRPATPLVVTARSSNQSLADASELSLFGQRDLRVLRVAPKPDRHGISIITVTVRDEAGLEASQSFLLSVTAVNDPPTITALPNVQGDVNTTIGPLSFQVGDKENFADELTVVGRSSNPTLIPLRGIILGGSGPGRTVTLAPAPDQSGLAIVTVEVADGNGATSSTQFEVVVHQTNGAPSIVLQPQDASAFIGSPLRLRVIATGPGPLAYQWQRAGVDVPAAVGSELSFAAVREEDAGPYRVLVSNGEGSVASVEATVTVEHPPLVLTARRAGDTFELSFPTSPSERYVVEYREHFDTGPWTALGTFDGTGANLSVVDPGPFTATRFYRVRME